MAISEEKMRIVIDNYFKSECDVNTSIRQAFEKGFRIGVKKGQSADRPIGTWEELNEFEDLNGVTLHILRCSKCGTFHRVRKLLLGSYINAEYCPHCGAYMREKEE